MLRFQQADWPAVEALRARLMQQGNATVMGAAQAFAQDFATAFSSVVLARVFVVVPFSTLPEVEREFAARAVHGDARLDATTRVLSLLGTFGRDPRWRDRTLSQGHLAVPLLDRAHVRDIPMIARLLADLEVDFAALDDGRPIASRPMLGGRNGTFFVADAQTATDAQGRFVIPSRQFISTHAVRTVFGMGGAYVDGTLAVAVLFTDELIDRLVVDRFPSLISNFKMATSAHLAAGRVYA